MAISKALQNKLSTNHPLNQEETLIVREALIASLGRVAALGDQTKQLQEKLNSLEHQKQQLSVFVLGYKGFLSPARRLLPEILQEIFCHCLPTTHNALVSNKEAPLLLGQVCRQWRQIAYATPKLWTSIHIITLQPLYAKHPLDAARRETISAWLSRSGVLPLSISMYTSGHAVRICRRGRRSPSNAQVQPYLDLIMPYTQRWKSLHLVLSHFDWTDLLGKLNGSQLPTLEDLHIEGDMPRRRDPDSQVSVCPLSREGSILSAPSLRALSLPAFYDRLPDLKAPWKQITGLNLGTRSHALTEIVKVLRLCPNLEFCSVFVGNINLPYNLATPPPEPFEMTPLNLHKLQSLRVVVRPRPNVGTRLFLDGLTSPSLRHFSYEQTDDGWWPGPGSPSNSPASRTDPGSHLQTSLRSLLRRLTCPLEELELLVTPFSETLVMEILPCVPNLKRLSLKGTEPSSEFDRSPPLSPGPLFPPNDFLISRFIPDEIPGLDTLQLTAPFDDDDLITAPPCLCPHLEVLQCIDAGNTGFSRQSLVKLLRSRTLDHRKHNIAHLRQVSMSFGSLFNQSTTGGEENIEFEKEIKALEEATGVRVNIRYPVLQAATSPASEYSPPLPRAYMGVDTEPTRFGGPGLKGFMF